ncbi:MAG: hypothetical protein ACHQII_08315 [Bacteroidia bacterium]
MKQFLIHIFLLCLTAQLLAQDDSLSPSIAPDYVLKDGIYLSFKDIQTNNPLPKENISMPGDKTQSDFISKTLTDNKEIIFTYKGSKYKAPVDSVWGYCQNGNIYVHFKDHKYWRITVFGSISHFIATVVVTRYVSNGYGMGYGGGFYGGMGGYNGMGGGGYTPVKQNETHEFLLDFKTGDVAECTPTNLEVILSRDMPLYEQYMRIKKRKRKDFMILYIRKYNNEHPISFPKN